MLDALRRQIARVTNELRHQVRRTPEACRLKTIPGIAWILAYTLLAEIGPIARFKSIRHLASYSLLAPQADDSGDEDPSQPPQGRHVGKFGRRTLKWAWIEAAHSAVKHPRFKEIYDRRTNGGKRDRNRGLIAVAHELCRVAGHCGEETHIERESQVALVGDELETANALAQEHGHVDRLARHR